MAIWMKTGERTDWHPYPQWLHKGLPRAEKDTEDVELDRRPVGVKVLPLFMRAKVKELP